jgi:hypothetical protein
MGEILCSENATIFSNPHRTQVQQRARRCDALCSRQTSGKEDKDEERASEALAL